MCTLSKFVGLRQPEMIRQQSCRAGFNVAEVVSLRCDAQVVCVDEAASVGMYGLVVGVDVEQHRCQYTSLW